MARPSFYIYLYIYLLQPGFLQPQILKVSYIQKAFYRPSIAKRCFAEPLQPEDLLLVFHKQNTFYEFSMYQRPQDLLDRQNIFYKASMIKGLFTGRLQPENLFQVFYSTKTLCAHSKAGHSIRFYISIGPFIGLIQS